MWSPDQSITRDFLAKQILRLHPRPTESERLGAGPSTSCFGKSSNWNSYMAWSSLKTCLCHSLLLLLINNFFFFCWSISLRKFFTSDKWVVNFYALPVSKIYFSKRLRCLEVGGDGQYNSFISLWVTSCISFLLEWLKEPVLILKARFPLILFVLSSEQCGSLEHSQERGHLWQPRSRPQCRERHHSRLLQVPRRHVCHHWKVRVCCQGFQNMYYPICSQRKHGHSNYRERGFHPEKRDSIIIFIIWESLKIPADAIGREPTCQCRSGLART